MTFCPLNESLSGRHFSPGLAGEYGTDIWVYRLLKQAETQSCGQARPSNPVEIYPPQGGRLHFMLPNGSWAVIAVGVLELHSAKSSSQ